MPSVIYRKIRLRLVDLLGEILRAPNRIEPEAVVAPTARVRSSNLSGSVRIEDHATVHRSHLSGRVSVGRRTSLWGPDIFVYTRLDPIEFGNFCSVARDVSVHGYFHDGRRISTHFIGRNILGLPLEDELVSHGPTRIGHDVWIGAGVHVLSGVTIGNGAIIGAGSVVSRDVPAYSISVGVPATPVRFRFSDDLISRLEASRWWEWSDERIRERAGLFRAPVTEELLDLWL